MKTFGSVMTGTIEKSEVTKKKVIAGWYVIPEEIGGTYNAQELHLKFLITGA